MVVSQENLEKAAKLVKDKRLEKVKKIVAGGEHRHDSVYNGLKALENDTDLLLIHDGARPNINENLVEKVLQPLENYDGVIPVVNAKDTIKKVVNNEVVETVDRNIFKLVQTPQAFKKSALLDAHEKAKRNEVYGTDDAFLLEKFGYKIGVVEGNDSNIKITTRTDFSLVQSIFKDMRCTE